MLTALDALIDTGTGGRSVLALRQVCRLFLRVGFDGASDTLSLFDEVMTTLAMDLDEVAVTVLAPEVQRLPVVLPGFAATMTSRCHEISKRGEAPRDPIDEAPEPAVAAETPKSNEPESRAVARPWGDDGDSPLALARRASAAQLERIADLPNLPEALTAILASRGHGPAIVAALGNPGATFGRSTLTMLAELSAGDRALRLALLARPDLPDDAVDRLLPLIGREARARLIMSGTAPSVEDGRQALASAGDRPPPDRRPLDIILAEVENGVLPLDDAIAELSCESRMAEIAALATKRLSISYPAAHAMLAMPRDHAAAILMRALGAGEPALDAVMALRRRSGLSRPRDASSTLDAYARQDAEEARVLVRLVDRNVMAAEALREPVPRADYRLSLVG
jgi:hypothetical protein